MASETHRITAVDLAHDRIRIPLDQKNLLPGERTRVAIRLRGRSLPDVAWDPRMGPDRERSGVLHVGRVIRDLVQADERLSITIDGEEIVLT